MRADIDIHWIGHPLDCPKDIRARRFMLSWNVPGNARPLGTSDTDPVFRVSFYCNGSCSWPAKQDYESDDGLDSDGMEEDAEEEQGPAPKRTVRVVCPHKAKLQVCTTSDMPLSCFTDKNRWRSLQETCHRPISGCARPHNIPAQIQATLYHLASCASKQWNVPVWA